LSVLFATTALVKAIVDIIIFNEAIIKKISGLHILSDSVDFVESIIRRMWAIVILSETMLMVESMSRRLYAIKVINNILQLVQRANRCTWRSPRCEVIQGNKTRPAIFSGEGILRVRAAYL
jgi:hypothetical protein